MSNIRAGVELPDEHDEWATLDGRLQPNDVQGSRTHPNGGRGPAVLIQAESPVELIDHPRYRVVGTLGRGGMGTVYKAEHRVMKRTVALKVIADHLISDPDVVERFRREVEAAARLSHPNIVTAYDAEQVGTCHFLVMEYVEGTDLANYVKKKGPLPVAHACHFIRQAALGLQHAHERGMVHRDIKPHNLMLTPTGVVKITDFGLARLAVEGVIAGGLTGENVLMGSADYIAPEQAEDARTADIRADVYSLGCTLFHLLAARPPFATGSALQKIMAHANAAVPLADLPQTIPEDVRSVLAKMLEKDPANRYQTPAEVAKALRLCRKASSLVEIPKAARKDAPLSVPESRTREDRPATAPRLSGDTQVSPVPPREKKRGDKKSGPAVARPLRKRRKVSRWPMALIGVLVLVTVLAGAALLSRPGLLGSGTTPEVPADGEVVVRCKDTRVQVAILSEGKLVKMIRHGPQAEPLPVGDYELEVVGGAPELRGFTGKFSIGAGDRMVVEVRREGLEVFEESSRPPPPRHPYDKPPPKPRPKE